MSKKHLDEEILARAQYFVDCKYTARADDRQKAMGLAYVEMERADLAREITSFVLGELSRITPKAADRERLAANFLRQTDTPLAGRTEPTVSWFGTPAERDLIVWTLCDGAQEWQDISTAKDGVPVLGMNKHGDVGHTHRVESDGDVPAYWWNDQDDDEWHPLWWMPALPPMPNTLIAEERSTS